MKNFLPPRNTPSRDEYYMGLAFWIAAKSKDPSTQVGSIVISPDNEPLGTGYNGPPAEINDYDIDWDRPAKYKFIHHAEDNAIKFSREIPRNSTIYVTMLPCKSCMLDIARAKIKRVVYFDSKTKDGSLVCNQEEWDQSLEIATKAKILVEQFSGNLNWMRDWVKKLESMGVFD